MKNTKKFAVAASLLLLFSSCVKQLDVPATPVVAPTAGTIEKFSDIQVSDNFNWATTTPIKLTINGAVGINYQLQLTVVDPEGNVVLKKMHNGTDQYAATLQLPSRFQYVTVSFGDTSEKITYVNNTVTFNIP